MFLGHYGVGFAAKRFAPNTSLGFFFIAALLPDLLWPVLVLLGVERVAIAPGVTRVSPLVFEYYPYSHSLVAVALWAAAAAALCLLARGGRKTASVLGLAVLSHWALDALVHRPDLPVTPGGGLKAGLGLWDSVPATIAVEGVVFAAGVTLYAHCTRSTDRAGKYGTWGIVAALVFIFAGQFSGAAPPDAPTVAIAGLAQWVFVFLGFWTDRHRSPGAAV